MSSEITIKSLLPAKYSSSLSVIHEKTFVGIDFGTSTTVVSFASFDVNNKIIKCETIRLEQKLEDGTIYSSDILPSVIAWDNDKILVGQGASNLKYKLKRGKNIWFSFKMELGEDLGTKYYDSELRDKSPFYIRNPKDAARVFFMYIKMLVERFCENNNLSSNIEYAVSIPASFEANQRKDLMEALNANGMVVSTQALIDEPNAAFLGYLNMSLKDEKSLMVHDGYNPKVLVFDFGAGTCDISILEIGKDVNGVYSKNISISKFSKLGGDDIDRYITYHYLVPRLLVNNGKNMNDFKTPEKRYIATQLFKIAERLKILMCKNLSRLMSGHIVPALKDSDMLCEIEVDMSIETNKGILYQNVFSLSYKEFTDVMSIFLKKGRSNTTKIKGEEEYYSIFSPIDSAISKAKTRIDELDYVLFIGGSSQNPYVQEALNNYLSESEILLPANLQTQVSEGAAIHSLLMNGLGKCVIQPITSESILVITKDEQPKIILPAGTIIPSDTIIIDDLVTSKEGQEAIELPVCVGNMDKLLFNMKIEAPKPKGFRLNTPIHLTLEINADKLLLAKAICMGISCMVEPQNPFANKELTTEERIVLRAEKQANLETESNGGRPSEETLIALRQAYIKAGNDFRAAETFELQNELYPSGDCYNSIGVLYDNSGNKEKAIQFYQLAIETDSRNVHANANLGFAYKFIDKEKSKKYLQQALEINPNHDMALIELGRLEKEKGKIEEANEKFQRAYDILMKKWNTDTMSKSDYSWLASVAEELGKKDFAYQVRQAQPKLGSDKYYDDEYLAKTKNNQLEKL